ncbi:MAG: hypothetical protein RMJ66_04510 [Bacteroidia bacterium]|nr:hypothetical protein [Bacteroidia bacterium]
MPFGVAPALFVRSYERVRYKGVWEGVDVVFYHGERGELEYDFELRGGVDPSTIRMRVYGADLELREGRLVLRTPLGELEQGVPLAWAGNRSVRCGWRIEGSEVGFWVEGRRPDEPLRIDPTVGRVWGTYYGGEADEGTGWSHRGIATDAAGNVYFTGTTFSSTQIATANAHQTQIGDDQFPWGDAVLAKFSPSGQLLWATYYGGIRRDVGHACVLDGDGAIYVAGYTSTPHTPPCQNCIAEGGHQTTLAGEEDAFLVKFSPSGVRIWGTYYGGPMSDYGFSCAVDGSGGCVFGRRDPHSS